MYNWIFAAASIFCMIWQKKERKSTYSFPLFFQTQMFPIALASVLGVGKEGRRSEGADLWHILQIYLFLKAQLKNVHTFFSLLWFTGLSLSLRLLHSALLFPGKTLRSVPCLSFYILLSIVRLSSHLTCLLLFFFCHATTLCPAGEGRGLGQAGLCPSCRRVPCTDQHGSHFFCKVFF